VDDRPAQIEALTARLALLEQRTADEAAAIRAALDELGSDQPARPTPPPIPLPSLPVRAPSEPRQARDLATLSEPRALAFAGGVVTLFGIVLVFVLAANRGWIGPSIRCAIGAGVSGLLVVAALVIRRRFGSAASALAAAGAGVGGFFVTLYAASRGYHLLGNEFVWAGVVANAALAVALALAWRSEFLAALGLVAVVVAPLAVEGHLTGIGLGAGVSAAVVALGIGQQRCWRALGALVSGLAFIQVSVYIVEARRHSFFDGSAVHIAWQHRTTAGVLACFVFGLALALHEGVVFLLGLLAVRGRG